MRRIILFLLLLITINFAANPFASLTTNESQSKSNEAISFIYTMKEAKLGRANAQFNLALMYARGTEVEKDEKEAFKWFHKAARNHHVEAKFYMGLSFAQGRGVRKHQQLARYWFKLAAKAGHKKALHYLKKIEDNLNKEF